MNRSVGVGAVLGVNLVVLVATSPVEGPVCDDPVPAEEIALEVPGGAAEDSAFAPDTADTGAEVGAGDELHAVGFRIEVQGGSLLHPQGTLRLTNDRTEQCAYGVYVGEADSDLGAFPSPSIGLPAPRGWTRIRSGQIPAAAVDGDAVALGEHQVDLSSGLPAVACDAAQVVVVTCAGVEVHAEVGGRGCAGSCGEGELTLELSL